MSKLTIFQQTWEWDSARFLPIVFSGLRKRSEWSHWGKKQHH